MDEMDQFAEEIDKLIEQGRWDEARERIKHFVLKKVFGSEKFKPTAAKAIFDLNGVRVHVRHTWVSVRSNWWFDINPNTLRADFELWLCGYPSLWYLVPVSAIRYMNEAPTAYPNTEKSGTTEVTVNEDNDTCIFARNEPRLDVSRFRHGRLTNGGR